MKSPIPFLKQHATVSITLAVIIILIAALAARLAKKNTAPTDDQSSKPSVQLINTKDYMQDKHAVSANGTVESLEQADLKSQATGKITKINVSVGQKVTQGQILATLEQSNQAAALTSARGALAQAQANYNRVMSGASNEDVALAQAAVDSAQSALDNTQKQQQIAVDSAYKTLLNSGLAAIGGSSNSGATTIAISGSYTSLETGEYTITVYSAGDGMHYQVSGLEKSQGLVQTSPQPIGTRGLYLQFSSMSVPAGNSWTVTIPNTQGTGYVANNNAYQSAIQGQKSAVAAAQNGLTQAKAALDLKKSQARPAEVQSAQAQILTAQGQVQSAQAALENTIIRAPFDGIISAVPVKFADLVSPGSIVMSIVSRGGLQVKIFVSDSDLTSIHVTDIAKIGTNNATGTVTNVAPSVNANTKTAEVDIAVNDPTTAGLTIGQNVSVLVAGNNSTSTTEQKYILPLQAVKITPDGHNYVYTLDSQKKAQQTEVTIGKVDGENVEVLSGLSADMQILSNAYGVSLGDAVEVK